MNRKIVFGLVIAAAAGGAFAQQPAIAYDELVPTRSNEEVAAELAAFKKAGVNPWSGLYDPLKTFTSKSTRDEVTAAYLASRSEVAALTAEDSGSAWLAGAGQPPASATMAGMR